jgi:outer membrane protein TolC
MKVNGTIARHATLLLALCALAGARTSAQQKTQSLVQANVRAQGDTVVVTLEDAVTRALSTGDEARLAAALVDVSDAQVDVARAAGLPQLRLSSTYNHVFENARAQAVGAIFNQPNTYTAYGNISQTVFQGGRIFNGSRAASRFLSASQMTQAETRSQIAVDVLRAYMNGLLTDRLLAIQLVNYDLASQQLEQVQQLEKAGRAARYDVLSARVSRGNLEPTLIQARTDRDLALLEIKRLTNIPIDKPLKLATTLDTAFVRGIATQIAADAGTGDTRPALAAAKYNADARHAAVSVARADLLPTISLNLQTGFQAFPLGNRLPNGKGQLLSIDCAAGARAPCTSQNGGWFGDRSLGVIVSWPIFDGLRTKANIDVANANARIADLQFAQQREAVAIDVARTRENLTRALSLFETRKQNSAEADEAFRLAKLRFTRGLSTQLEVSTAQLALLTAQTNEARAVYDLYSAAADLARSLGRPIPGVGDLKSAARQTR